MKMPIVSSIDRRDAALGMAFGRGCEAGWMPSVGPLADVVNATEAHSAALCRDALNALSRRPEQPVAVSIRLPFCASQCLCCDRPIQAAQSSRAIDDYVADLCRQIEFAGALAGTGRDLTQLHLGGGMANELSESQLARLMGTIGWHWKLLPETETSAECDPRRVSLTQLVLLRGLGVRCIKFGVLDLDPVVQQAIGRSASAALVDDACELARHAGIRLVEIDLMAGLPKQTEAGWRNTLDAVLSMGPDRVTVVRYRHRPWMSPVQALIDTDELPSIDEANRLAEIAARVLREAGYRWIGADHFVLEGDELSNALDQGRLRRDLVAYTGMPSAPVLGFGVGAVSEIEGHLFWSEPTQVLWREAVRAGRLPVAYAQESNELEQRRRRAVDQLLCTLEMPSAVASDGLEAAYHKLASHEADGLVRTLPDRIIVTDRGRTMLNVMCSEFGLGGAQPVSMPHITPCDASGG